MYVIADSFLSLLIFVFALIISTMAATISFLFKIYFKDTPLESPWKTLFLIPIFMFVLVFMELMNISTLRVRSILMICALTIVLISLYRFYNAISYIYPVGIAAATVEKIDPLSPREKERIVVRSDVYWKLNRLAQEKAMTVNELVYRVIVPEWLEMKRTQ